MSCDEQSFMICSSIYFSSWVLLMKSLRFGNINFYLFSPFYIFGAAFIGP